MAYLESEFRFLPRYFLQSLIETRGDADQSKLLNFWVSCTELSQDIVLTSAQL